MAQRTVDTINLPPADTIKNFDDLKTYLNKIRGLLNNNQSDIYQDLTSKSEKAASEIITGQKTMMSLTLGASQNCNQKQMVSMVLENRTSDPTEPVTGQIWLRTDLL